MKAGLPIRSTLPYLLFAVLVVIFLWKPIFAGKALLPGDYLAEMELWKHTVAQPDSPPQWNPLQWDAISQYYPWRVFYQKWMRQGIIPLWNPHQFCGTPFLANGQSAVLYPLNLVFLIFDPITALTAYAGLHLFLAAAFAYALLRALGCRDLAGIIGGIAYAFCAFMVRWLELPTFVGAAVWLPLSLLVVHQAVERDSVFRGMLSGAVIAMAFLAGHLQIAFYVLLTSILWWFWTLGQVYRNEGKACAFRKVVVPCIGCVIVFALIVSAQLVPTLELARNSHRASGPTAEGYDWFIGNSLKPYHLITAFIPDFYGNPANDNFILLGRVDQTRHVASAADYMEYGAYAGVLPLVFALLGLGLIRQRSVGFFALLSGAALLCALGTPVNWLIYHLVPGFSSLGGPNRILLLYLFGIAALAAFGVDWFAEHAADTIGANGRGARAGYAACHAAAAAVIAAVACDLVARAFLAEAVGVTETPGPFMLTAGRFVVFLVGTVLVVTVRSVNRIGRGTFAAAAVGLVIADLFAAGINYNPTCERSSVYPRTELTDKLKRLTASGARIAPINPNWSLFETPDAILPPNSAMVYGLYDVQGYDSLFTREYKDLSSEVQGQDSSPIENGNMVLIRTAEPAKLAEYLDVSYLVSPAGVTKVSGARCWTWKTPNKMRGPFAGGPSYPGWSMSYLGRRISEWRSVLLEPRPDRPNADFIYEPFSFRLGLFLSLLGVGTLSCTGTYEFLKRKRPKR